jgi:hypothetical protein
MYGRPSLAHTGAAAVATAGVTVLGVSVPWLAIGATALVVTGAVLLRLNGKRAAKGQ